MTDYVATIPEDIRAELASVGTVCELALTIKIDGPETELQAGQASRRLNSEAKRLIEHRLSITRPIDAAKKGVMDLFAPPIKALEDAERAVDRKIMDYRAEQQRLRDEQERKYREQAERERQEAERKAEELRAKAEAAKTEGRADYLNDLAEAQLEKAAAIVAPTIPELPKVEGVASVDRWSCEVTDLMALVKAVAAGQASLECLTANQTVLNGLARALKGGMTIPGVKAVNNPSLAKRGF